jgi:hypothetical protein
MYTNLAYGAQGLQYFTYWTPVSSTEDFRGAPISLTGKRSAVYDDIKLLNQEIKNLAGVFYGSKLISIKYAGKETPMGTNRLSTLPASLKVLDTAGKPAIVSILENGDKRFLVVVNMDYKHSMPLTLLGNDNLKRILKDGSIVPASIYDTTVDVGAGDIAVYMF